MALGHLLVPLQSGKKRAASTTPKIAEKKVRMDTPAKPGEFFLFLHFAVPSIKAHSSKGYESLHADYDVSHLFS